MRKNIYLVYMALNKTKIINGLLIIIIPIVLYFFFKDTMTFFKKKKTLEDFSMNLSMDFKNNDFDEITLPNYDNYEIEIGIPSGQILYNTTQGNWGLSEKEFNNGTSFSIYRDGYSADGYIFKGSTGKKYKMMLEQGPYVLKYLTKKDATNNYNVEIFLNDKKIISAGGEGVPSGKIKYKGNNYGSLNTLADDKQTGRRLIEYIKFTPISCKNNTVEGFALREGFNVENDAQGTLYEKKTLEYPPFSLKTTHTKYDLKKDLKSCSFSTENPNSVCNGNYEGTDELTTEKALGQIATKIASEELVSKIFAIEILNVVPASKTFKYKIFYENDIGEKIPPDIKLKETTDNRILWIKKQDSAGNAIDFYGDSKKYRSPVQNFLNLFTPHPKQSCGTQHKTSDSNKSLLECANICKTITSCRSFQYDDNNVCKTYTQKVTPVSQTGSVNQHCFVGNDGLAGRTGGAAQSYSERNLMGDTQESGYTADETTSDDTLLSNYKAAYENWESIAKEDDRYTTNVNNLNDTELLENVLLKQACEWGCKGKFTNESGEEIQARPCTQPCKNAGCSTIATSSCYVTNDASEDAGEEEEEEEDVTEENDGAVPGETQQNRDSERVVAAEYDNIWGNDAQSITEVSGNILKGKHLINNIVTQQRLQKPISHDKEYERIGNLISNVKHAETTEKSKNYALALSHKIAHMFGLRKNRYEDDVLESSQASSIEEATKTSGNDDGRTTNMFGDDNENRGGGFRASEESNKGSTHSPYTNIYKPRNPREPPQAFDSVWNF